MLVKAMRGHSLLVATRASYNKENNLHICSIYSVVLQTARLKQLTLFVCLNLKKDRSGNSTCAVSRMRKSHFCAVVLCSSQQHPDYGVFKLQQTTLEFEWVKVVLSGRPNWFKFRIAVDFAWCLHVNEGAPDYSRFFVLSVEG